jgi:2,5-diamino-6-(ribosylamino)-4(3H)-pyrimidinone 5'-phosphate reductase
MKVGLEMYGDGIPAEKESDFKKPKKSSSLPYWVIPDTRGTLLGVLHTFRRFEFCRDVVVLVSEKTPRRYIEYLRERDYDHYVIGKKHVDLKKSLLLLAKKYKIKTILADTGRILSNLLLDQGLVSEISLLVHPIIVGRKSYKIFGDVRSNVNLRPVKCRRIEKDYVWLVFELKA